MKNALATIVVVVLLLFAVIYLLGQNRPPEEASMIFSSTGEKFTIILESNSSSGFSWHSFFDPDKFELIDKVYVHDVTGTISGEGNEHFTFKALQEGNWQISFEYRKPLGEKAKADQERFYQVIIGRGNLTPTPNLGATFTPTIVDGIKIVADYKTKIVYGEDEFIDLEILETHCLSLGGKFGTCGSPCAEDAQACIQVCALVCVEIPVN